VTDWSLKLDGAAPRRLELTADRVAAARDALRPADTRSIRMAAENIRIFHEATIPEDSALTSRSSRAFLAPRLAAASRSAGLYVPGGSAPLFSSLLMLAIPAAVAGSSESVAVTPPSASGELGPPGDDLGCSRSWSGCALADRRRPGDRCHDLRCLELPMTATSSVATSCSDPATPMSPRPRSRPRTCPAARPSTCPPARPSCWSSSTATLTLRSPPPTCSARPSTTPTPRSSSSPTSRANIDYILTEVERQLADPAP
jgi:histidinol dehydrogenase